MYLTAHMKVGNSGSWRSPEDVIILSSFSSEMRKGCHRGRWVEGLGILPWALGEPFPLLMSIRSSIGPLLHGFMVAISAASAVRRAVVWF